MAPLIYGAKKAYDTATAVSDAVEGGYLAMGKVANAARISTLEPVVEPYYADTAAMGNDTYLGNFFNEAGELLGEGVAEAGEVIPEILELGAFLL